MADSGGGPLRITVTPLPRAGQDETGRGTDPASQGIDPSVNPPLPPTSRRGKPQEIAELHVNGMIYRDWESVSVRHAVGEQPPFSFRFTCSEGMPLAKNIAVMRIKPGDHVTIYLAGELAITGYVVVRQVHYDAFRHQIEIQGANKSFQATQRTPQTKTNEYNKQQFGQFCRSILGSIGQTYSEIPPIPNTVVPRISVTPGQSCHEIIEQVARPLGVQITSNVRGDYVAAGGIINGIDAVIEGKNIIEGREVIRNDGWASGQAVSAQKPGNNEEHGPKVTHMPHFADVLISAGSLEGVARKIQESVGWSQDFVKGRVQNESANLRSDSVWVTVVVHGWLRPSGGLWMRRQKVFVDSPMLIMKDALILKAVTFTQDNQTGSRSTLELVNDKALGGGFDQPGSSDSSGGAGAP